MIDDGLHVLQSTETGRQHTVDVGPNRHGSIDVHAQISDWTAWTGSLHSSMSQVEMCWRQRCGVHQTNWAFVSFSCRLLMRVQL